MAWTTDHTAIRPGLWRRLRRVAAGSVATALIGTAAAVLPAVPAHAAGPGQLIYVANQADNSIAAVDSASGATVATIPVGTSPANVALTPDGAQAWVVNSGSDSVSVIDTVTQTVVALVPVGHSPLPVVISPDGARVYVAHTGNPAGVEVIDTSSLTVAATLSTGGYPGALGLSPNGSRLYVGNFFSRSVSVIDTATNTVSATVPVSDPAGIAVSPDGAHVYVSNYNGRSVSVIDAATNTVVAIVPVGQQPMGIAVAPDGGSVYVGNRLGNSVSVLDTATNIVIATIGVGAGTNAVLADPDGTRVYATNSFSNNMSVIDTATLTVAATVPTGSRPYGLAIGKVVLPAVTALAPDHGPTTGGTTVTLTGTHLTGTTAVDFDGTPASGVTVVDDTTITAVAPPHTAGAVDVTLTAKGRTAPAGTYTYQVPAPTVTGIAPGTGPAAGGTAVTVTGSNFTGATAVTFGTTPAASFAVVNDTTITAAAPAASVVGPVDITVTTPAGTSTTGSADRYAYVYDFAGFLAPVRNAPDVNLVNAGRSIPIKFSLGGDRGLNILKAGSPTSQASNCGTGTADPIELGTVSNSGLTYDPATDTYTYVWKTEKAWAGTCRTFHLTLADGTDHVANFQFK